MRSEFVLAIVYQLSEVTPLRGAVVGTAHAQTPHLARIWFVRTRSAPGVGRAGLFVCSVLMFRKVNRTEGDAVPVGFAVDDTRYRWPEKAELAHARPFFRRALPLRDFLPLPTRPFASGGRLRMTSTEPRRRGGLEARGQQFCLLVFGVRISV